MAAADARFLQSGAGAFSRPKLAKRVYLHLRHGHGAPLELLRWNMAARFGWTLPEIDALSVADLHELAQIDDARVKATQKGEVL